jgi:hypothetical protein
LEFLVWAFVFVVVVFLGRIGFPRVDDFASAVLVVDFRALLIGFVSTSFAAVALGRVVRAAALGFSCCSLPSFSTSSVNWTLRVRVIFFAAASGLTIGLAATAEAVCVLRTRAGLSSSGSSVVFALALVVAGFSTSSLVLLVADAVADFADRFVLAGSEGGVEGLVRDWARVRTILKVIQATCGMFDSRWKLKKHSNKYL